MNTLAYGLMSLLTLTPTYGYDLIPKIKLFWPATHGQIYPLLAKLVDKGLISYEQVHQSDKPDKKVYSLTESGQAALQAWIAEPTAAPALRDELALKTFCIRTTDRAIASKLFTDRIQLYKTNMKELEDKREQLRIRLSIDDLTQIPLDSPYLGGYLLMQKAEWNMASDLRWCEWALKLLDRSESVRTP
ncbi:PadR family transcriptional regulator [Paenibacillus sp. MBLB4367]|uniref:PadR family transcriptional regulator n=1 Tax=Paenibacillus sp. MBLB4367 TaxID=3384767 RepID=UPI003907E8BE